jgi:putative endonuclease
MAADWPGAESTKHQNTAGQAAENAAANFLSDRGAHILQRNFRCRLGELDIIALDGVDLVFVEVRYRRRADYGDARESLTPRKRQRLIRAAALWLQRHPWQGWRRCRFDLITFDGEISESQCQWIRNAFTLTE